MYPSNVESAITEIKMISLFIAYNNILHTYKVGILMNIYEAYYFSCSWQMDSTKLLFLKDEMTTTQPGLWIQVFLSDPDPGIFYGSRAGRFCLIQIRVFLSAPNPGVFDGSRSRRFCRIRIRSEQSDLKSIKMLKSKKNCYSMVGSGYGSRFSWGSSPDPVAEGLIHIQIRVNNNRIP